MINDILDGIYEFLNKVLGVGEKDWKFWQIGLRALVMYLVVLVFVKIGKKRLFGRNTAFDVILGIIIGSVASRAINGQAPLGGTILACILLVAIHWLFGYFSFKSHSFGDFVKGKKRILIDDGKIDWKAMKKSTITEHDLKEAIRQKSKNDDVSQIKLAVLERNGSISIIPKENQTKNQEPSIRVVDIEVKEGVQRIQLEIKQ